MKVLLIEDDISKEKKIRSVYETYFPECSMDVERSIMSGKITLKKYEYDIVLLDMSLPLFDNDDPKRGLVDHGFDPFGGVSVLDEIDRLSLKCKVVIITAYEVIGDEGNKKDLQTLDKELKRDYPHIVVDSIFYNISSSDWETKMTQLIKTIMKG